ncbi:MAG: hypothetical protein JXA14_24585 [Anaerolineae bacterium]|nr:hypothetical protein [Anaerolineae bacterium]
MRAIAGMCAGVLLLALRPAVAGGIAWSDPVEAFHTITGYEECKFIPEPPWDTMEPPWDDGPCPAREFIVLDSVGPDGWVYGKEWWAGDWYWLGQDKTQKSQGASSVRAECSSPTAAEYADIYLVREFPTVVGQSYTFSFDLALDPALLTSGPAGQHTGDDHQPSVSWQIRHTVENTLETIALGRRSPAAIADTEDYPNHVRNSIWIGDPAMWDGNFHTHSLTFTAEGDWAVFALKHRSHKAPAHAGLNLDNLILAVPCNPVRFDEDGDGDVDQADFASFQVCLTDMNDPNGIYDPAACQCMDSDNDQDIDASDLLAFEACASAPGVPANPDCDDRL